MAGNLTEITDKTRVPLFAALGVLPILFGGMIWLTSIDSKASSAKEQLTELKPMLAQVISDVGEVKGQLRIIRDLLKDRK